MSLATRLSAFFLIALALVLVGFSGALYVLARSYLVGQLDERLQSALDTLEASVDIEPGGLEWEPADRQMTLGVETGPGAVCWVVRDDRGALVDRSANAAPARFPRDWMPAAWPAKPADGTAFGATPGWRLAARRLRLDDLLKQGRGHPDDEPGYEVPYRVLVLVVGLSPTPVESALGRLGLTLSVLSLGVWTVSVAAGRWLCLRALTPVSRMAKAATAMTAADLGQRLPISGTGDELDALGRAFNDLLVRLHEAFIRLHAAYDGQRRFAGDASHQLRTPLAALLGQVQVARRRERPPEEYRRILDRVIDEGLRLRGIVDSLLFLADPEGSPVEFDTVDLATWLAEHVGRLSDHPRASGLRVEVLGDGPLAARVNPLLLGQLVDNLLDNAFKYSPAGSPVTVRCWAEPGSLLLSVTDRGYGLSSEEAARVFEPFYRTDQTRRNGQPGVGLGLPVARRIAAAFGGSLDVLSEPGSGCVFALRLPAEAGDA
jgi:two-component system, OmpR family, sensor kinase